MSNKYHGYKPLSADKISQILSNNASVQEQANAAVTPPPAAPAETFVSLSRSAEFDTLLPVDRVKDFLAFARDVISRYEGNIARQKELEDETQDLMHVAELTEKVSAAQGYKNWRKLQEVRRERRACKNETELLKPLYDYLQDRAVINQLSQIQGKCSSSKQVISMRKYALRTDVMN